MGFKRAIIQDGGLSRASRAGDSVTSPIITVVATDTALTLTIPQIAGGIIQYTGFSVGRVLTTPTATDFLAAYPEMDVGDSYQFKVSVVPAFAGTWAAGVGVTLAGKTTAPASTVVDVYVTKNSTTAVTWNVL